jgi:hypothetical protein
MSNDDIDYGLKLVLGLREEFKYTPRESNAPGMKHVYSFNGRTGITENFPTRDEGSFEVKGLGTVDYTLNDVNGPLLRMSHSFDEIDRALSSGSPFL